MEGCGRGGLSVDAICWGRACEFTAGGSLVDGIRCQLHEAKGYINNVGDPVEGWIPEDDEQFEQLENGVPMAGQRVDRPSFFIFFYLIKVDEGQGLVCLRGL